MANYSLDASLLTGTMRFDRHGMQQNEAAPHPPIDEKQIIINIVELLYSSIPTYAEIFKQPLTPQNQGTKQTISMVINNALFVWTKVLDRLEFSHANPRDLPFNRREVVDEVWHMTLRDCELDTSRYEQNTYAVYMALSSYVSYILSLIDDGHILDRLEWSENLGNSSIIVTAFCLRIY